MCKLVSVALNITATVDGVVNQLKLRGTNLYPFINFMICSKILIKNCHRIAFLLLVSSHTATASFYLKQAHPNHPTWILQTMEASPFRS